MKRWWSPRRRPAPGVRWHRINDRPFHTKAPRPELSEALPATTAIPYSQFPSNRGEQTPSFRRPWRARQTVPRLRSSTIPASPCTGSGPGGPPKHRGIGPSLSRGPAPQRSNGPGSQTTRSSSSSSAGRCPGIDSSDGAAPPRLALGPFGRQVFQGRSAPQGLQRGAAQAPAAT